VLHLDSQGWRSQLPASDARLTHAGAHGGTAEKPSALAGDKPASMEEVPFHRGVGSAPRPDPRGAPTLPPRVPLSLDSRGASARRLWGSPDPRETPPPRANPGVMPRAILPLGRSKGIPDRISANLSCEASALPWIQPVFWLRFYLGGKKCRFWLLSRDFFCNCLCSGPTHAAHVSARQSPGASVMQIPNSPLGPGAANKPPALAQTPAVPS